MGYGGAKDIPTLKKTAKFTLISATGVNESHPHSLQSVKDSPNYHGR
jgi:IMP dehydrogenase